MKRIMNAHIFFLKKAPTFFVFLGGPRHGEHGATVKKIENVDFIWRKSEKKFQKKNFVQRPKLAPVLNHMIK